MRLKDIIGLGVALILAIVVAFVTRYFLTKDTTSKSGSQVQQAVNFTKVLVAGKVLEEGNIIQPGDVVWQDWPNKSLSPSYIREDVLKVEDLTGAVVRNRVDQGEPLQLADFAQPGEKGILAAIITPGKRAISIEVTPQGVSSGLISSGDYVDVIVARNVQRADGGSVASKTIVKNVKVLAVDTETTSKHEKPKAAPRVVTLEVTPAEAEAIAAAAKDGTLSLSLHSLAKSDSQADPVPEEVPANEQPVILMRGNEKSEINVQDSTE